MNSSPELLIFARDETDVQAVLGQLPPSGPQFECRHVRDSAAARHALESQRCAALLLCNALEDSEALALLHQAHTQWPHVPCIAISAAAGAEQVTAFLKQGGWDFVPQSRLALLMPALEQCWQDAAARQARQGVEHAVRDSRLAALNMMEDAMEARRQAECIAATLRAEMTERRKAEEALRVSSERLRLALQAANQGIYDLDVRTGACMVSPEYALMLGYDPATFVETNQAWLERLHPLDLTSVSAAFSAYLAGQTSEYRVEFRQRTSTGSWKWILSLGRIVERDQEGKPSRMLGTHTDITELKRLEQERSTMEAQLRQQQKLESLGTLAGGVAHEINNPINGIMNYAQLIQDRLDPASPLLEFAGEIIHETQRVASIVRNLLTFARNEKQHHSSARVMDIVESTLTLIRTVIRHDQIELRVEMPPDLPQLRCRSQQIQQVLMNLMTNARDALNERYPGHHANKMLIVSASALLKDGQPWIRLSVEDHGAGISPEVRLRMFDPFFTTKPRDRGTGLGLSISHSIVKEHGGEMTVECIPGLSTLMHVDLPAELD